MIPFTESKYKINGSQFYDTSQSSSESDDSSDLEGRFELLSSIPRPHARPRDRRSGHYADEHQSPNQSRAQPSTLQLHPNASSHRRPPTPPYITSISTHDQYSPNGVVPPSTHARPALSATRSAPRQDSRASTEDFVDGDGDEEAEDDDIDVDSEFARAAGASKPSSRSYANGVNLPRVATLDDRPSSSRWHHTNTSARHERDRVESLSRDQDQDELDSDMDGDAELDAPGAGSHPASRPRSTDGYRSTKVEGADGDGDADTDIMDAVDATMKTED